MNLYSDHIYLRPIVPEDGESLLHLRVRNREFLQPYEPLQADRNFTREGIGEQIAMACRAWDEGNGYAFGIFRKEDDQLIGRVNLSNVSRGAWQSCTIGYYLDQTENGKGYMTEAVRLAVDFAFKQAGLHRVQAAIMPHNMGSIRVVEKVGFWYEGLARYYLQINGKWEDHRIYSITQEGWPSEQRN